MIVNENNTMPYMKSMTACLTRMVNDGYVEDFKIIDAGLQSLKNERIYQPEDIEVVNFYRFEGESDPDDNAILYVVKTADGLKGTVVDAYGPYSDPKLNQFMQDVHAFHKKV